MYVVQDNTVRQVNTNKCLELSTDFNKLEMKPCIGTDSQIWYWQRRTPDSELSSSTGVARL